MDGCVLGVRSFAYNFTKSVTFLFRTRLTLRHRKKRTS